MKGKCSEAKYRVAPELFHLHGQNLPVPPQEGTHRKDASVEESEAEDKKAEEER